MDKNKRITERLEFLLMRKDTSDFKADSQIEYITLE